MSIALSVIIATNNRCELLEKTLLSLSVQTLPCSNFEVVVVDHASTDMTSQLLSQLHRFPFSLNSFRMGAEVNSIGVLKNALVEHSKNKIIVSIDSGVICPPAFLAHHSALHENQDLIFVSGPCYGWEEEQTDSFWETLDSLKCPEAPPAHRDCRCEMMPSVKHAPWLLFWGCNFSVSKALFKECGGFDEKFIGWGWDDLDLGFRLQKAGAHFIFDLNSWCLHYPHSRTDERTRMKEASANWIRTYSKNQHPVLELWEAADYVTYDLSYESLICILDQAKKGESPDFIEEFTKLLESFPQPTGFWGLRHFSKDIHLLTPCPPNKNVNATWTLGVRTPFKDKYFNAIGVSRQVELFGCKLGQKRHSLLYYLFRELGRISNFLIVSEELRRSPIVSEVLNMLCDERLLDRKSIITI